jgi:hypothetical protein
VTRTPAISTNVLQNSAATGADWADPADRSGQHNLWLASPRKAITGRRTREPRANEHDSTEGFRCVSENQAFGPSPLSSRVSRVIALARAWMPVSEALSIAENQSSLRSHGRRCHRRSCDPSACR